jgi:hypothetical protein
MCNFPIETDDTETKSLLIPVLHTRSTLITQKQMQLARISTFIYFISVDKNKVCTVE